MYVKSIRGEMYYQNTLNICMKLSGKIRTEEKNKTQNKSNKGSMCCLIVFFQFTLLNYKETPEICRGRGFHENHEETDRTVSFCLASDAPLWPFGISRQGKLLCL